MHVNTKHLSYLGDVLAVDSSRIQFSICSHGVRHQQKSRYTWHFRQELRPNNVFNAVWKSQFRAEIYQISFASSKMIEHGHDFFVWIFDKIETIDKLDNAAANTLIDLFCTPFSIWNGFFKLFYGIFWRELFSPTPFARTSILQSSSCFSAFVVFGQML